MSDNPTTMAAVQMVAVNGRLCRMVEVDNPKSTTGKAFRLQDIGPAYPVTFVGVQADLHPQPKLRQCGTCRYHRSTLSDGLVRCAWTENRPFPAWWVDRVPTPAVEMAEGSDCNVWEAMNDAHP